MSVEPPFFSVIIVNYNGGEYLQMAMDSLKVQTFTNFEVFVVDNASADDSFAKLDIAGLQTVQLMPQTENLGFARGNNEAAKLAKGEWLALLNPDAVAAPDWLAKIAGGISRHPQSEMFACTQLSMDDPRLTDGTGDCYFIGGIPWRGGFGRPASEIPPESECFGPCGASAVYRRDVFERLGGFDEDFFCYVEDVDLAFRVRRIGGKCIFLPKAVVTHKGSAISGRTSAFSLFYGSRNRLWTYVQNMPLGMLIVTLPLHIGFSGLILLRGLFTGNFYHAARGMASGLKHIGKALGKRKTVNAMAKDTQRDKSIPAMALNPITLIKRKAHYSKLS